MHSNFLTISTVAEHCRGKRCCCSSEERRRQAFEEEIYQINEREDGFSLFSG